jgi:integrase
MEGGRPPCPRAWWRRALGRDVQSLGNLVRAKRPIRLPNVLTRDEVKLLLSFLEPDLQLIGRMLYTHVLNREPGGVRSPMDRM